LDLGISFLPVEDDELGSIPLFTEELSLAVPSDHPLAHRKEVEIEMLEHNPIVLLPSNYFLRQLIDTYCAELGIILRPTLEMSTLESLTQMVSEGIGVTILPTPYLDFLNNQRIAKVRLINPVMERKIGFVYRKDKFMCATTRAFINQVTE